MKITLVFCISLVGVFLSVVARDIEIYEEINASATVMPLQTTPRISPLDVTYIERVISQTTPVTAVSTPFELVTEATCECGIFKGQFESEYKTPLLNRTLSSVSCDFNGQEKCLKLCATLAEADKYYGPKLLCASLGHYNQLMVSVYSRILCNNNDWIYTGLGSSAAFCCRGHQVVDCSEIGNRLN